MMGLVYKDMVDAAVGTIFYIESRVAITETHTPIVNAYSTYVVPRPIPLPKWSSIIRPFSWQTWIGQGVVLASMLVITWVTLRVITTQNGTLALETSLMFVMPTFLAEDVTNTSAWNTMNTKFRWKMIDDLLFKTCYSFQLENAGVFLDYFLLLQHTFLCQLDKSKSDLPGNDQPHHQPEGDC